LQDGDPENLQLWEKIRDISMSSFLKIYKLLDVKFDHSLGESFYRDQVDEVYQGLSKHKICQEDDGALVVFHPEHKRFAKQPFIIRKSDGASNYATTDLATLTYRQKEWQAEQIIYVTDGRQVTQTPPTTVTQCQLAAALVAYQSPTTSMVPLA